MNALLIIILAVFCVNVSQATTYINTLIYNSSSCSGPVVSVNAAIAECGLNLNPAVNGTYYSISCNQTYTTFLGCSDSLCADCTYSVSFVNGECGSAAQFLDYEIPGSNLSITCTSAPAVPDFPNTVNIAPSNYTGTCNDYSQWDTYPVGVCAIGNAFYCHNATTLLLVEYNEVNCLTVNETWLLSENVCNPDVGIVYTPIPSICAITPTSTSTSTSTSSTSSKPASTSTTTGSAGKLAVDSALFLIGLAFLGLLHLV